MNQVHKWSLGLPLLAALAAPVYGALGCSGTFSQIVLCTGPTGYWPLNGNANDASGNGWNGTLNGVTFVAGGPPTATGNQAGVFNGSSYISMNTTATGTAFDTIEYNTSWSIVSWVKTTTTNGHFFLAKQQNSTPFRGWELTDPGVIMESFDNGNNAQFLIDGVGAITNTIGDGSWHFVVATYNGNDSITGFTLYVDGVPVATQVIHDGVRNFDMNTLGANTIVNNAPVTIGARQNGGVAFTGQLAELAVFTTQLSSGQISAMYTAAVPPPPSTPTPSSAILVMLGLGAAGLFAIWRTRLGRA